MKHKRKDLLPLPRLAVPVRYADLADAVKRECELRVSEAKEAAAALETRVTTLNNAVVAAKADGRDANHVRVLETARDKLTTSLNRALGTVTGAPVIVPIMLGETTIPEADSAYTWGIYSKLTHVARKRGYRVTKRAWNAVNDHLSQAARYEKGDTLPSGRKIGDFKLAATAAAMEIAGIYCPEKTS
jgi:hypothetical protein